MKPLKTLLIASALLLGNAAWSSAASQEPAGQEEKAQLRLRKTLKTREYQGKTVQGEERVISRGDSLWKILVKERGLSEKRFGRYLVIIGALNSHLKQPDVLEVGDTIFIPIRPDEILGIQIPLEKGEARLYRVKQGDYVYKILREQFGLQEKKDIYSAFKQVKKLNPKKKNWNLLIVGERILFPGEAKIATAAPGMDKPAEIIGLDYGRKLPVQANLHLLEQVMEALGNETRRGGEEALTLQEGTIHIDRDTYPVIRNPKIEQRVILDLESRIPPSIKTRLEERALPIPVVSAKKGASLHDVVSSLLTRLGYQSLPANRPIVIQDRGVGVQVQGEWMVSADSGGRQEMFIITLTDGASVTPDYLRDYLYFKGMSLKEILLPPSPASLALAPMGSREQAGGERVENWPQDKSALVDAFLKTYEITYSDGEQLSVSLKEGIRLDIKPDRAFDFDGKKVALFFRPLADEVKRALQEKEEAIQVVEIDLHTLTGRSVIARLLESLGERMDYREHRFHATEGGSRDKVVITLSGFYLPQRSMILTDREIPKDLEPFFAAKGLRIVYFH